MDRCMKHSDKYISQGKAFNQVFLAGDAVNYEPNSRQNQNTT